METIKKCNKSDIQNRKIQHLKIPIHSDVQHVKNYFNYIQLIHNPLPEIELEDINTSTQFFNKKISAPICISAITGGPSISKSINQILATAAREENIILSVGSQRIGLEDSSFIDSFTITREIAPNIPIIGNIGIGQITSTTFNVHDFVKCIIFSPPRESNWFFFLDKVIALPEKSLLDPISSKGCSDKGIFLWSPIMKRCSTQ